MRKIKRWKFTQAMLQVAAFKVMDALPLGDEPRQFGQNDDRGFVWEAVGPASNLKRLNFMVASTKDVGALTKRFGWLTIALKILYPGWVEIHEWLQTSLLQAMQGKVIYDAERDLKVFSPRQGVLIVALGAGDPMITEMPQGDEGAEDAIAILPVA